MQSQTWVPLVIVGCLAFLFGIFCTQIGQVLIQLINHGFRSFRQKQAQPFTELRNAKLNSTLVALFAFSTLCWFANYRLSEIQGIDPIWGELVIGVFGVATAGLLGGIVFEMFLRKEILAEVSETLAEIVVTDKKVVEQIFTPDKRNQIIKAMLQLNVGNDLYGSALYEDFVAKYTDSSIKYGREFRFAFKDHVTFCDIDSEHADLKDRFYEVIDKISYRTILRDTNFIAGCASNEDQLYKLFSDPKSIYRWLLKVDDFDSLMTSYKGFSISLTIEGEECSLVGGEGTLGERGFEFEFENPFRETSSADVLSTKIGNVVDFHIEVATLHSIKERILSIHLAYPVKGAEIVFDYESCDKVRAVTTLHFLTGGQHNPRVEAGVEPKFSPKQHRRFVFISDDHWLFPDAGVVFAW